MNPVQQKAERKKYILFEGYIQSQHEVAAPRIQKMHLFLKKNPICMFVHLFLAFFLSLGAVPLFFLGGSPSIGRPPPSALRLRQRSRSEGRDLSLWPIGGCFLQADRAHAAFFSAQ